MAISESDVPEISLMIAQIGSDAYRTTYCSVGEFLVD